MAAGLILIGMGPGGIGGMTHDAIIAAKNADPRSQILIRCVDPNSFAGIGYHYLPILLPIGNLVPKPRCKLANLGERHV